MGESVTNQKYSYLGVETDPTTRKMLYDHSTGRTDLIFYLSHGVSGVFVNKPVPKEVDPQAYFDYLVDRGYLELVSPDPYSEDRDHRRFVLFHGAIDPDDPDTLELPRVDPDRIQWRETPNLPAKEQPKDRDRGPSYPTDSPTCQNCGATAVRCGTVSRCFNCGSSTQIAPPPTPLPSR